ncbi:inositol monophosphatase [Trifolium medium]|uniref:Inositol monophosphatase n=1 Tax=Trifolium medium TaxID=97028 RepID=A0A392RNX5_9FABA|nr:inositol monophosphatase [Trifolium medium]
MASSSSSPHQLHDFSNVANKAADAAGDVIRQYFRKKNFDIIHKQDLSPVTIADQSAEEAMVSIILHNFPSHAV